MFRHFPRVALALHLALAACGGEGSEPTAPPKFELRVVAGAGVTDTVLAKLAQPLTVEVLVNGKPANGIVLRFESLRTPGPPNFPGVLMSAPSPIYFTDLVDVSTNPDGRASVIVRMGERAGATGVEITNRPLGLTYTAPFTVLPGNAPNRMPEYQGFP